MEKTKLGEAHTHKYIYRGDGAKAPHKGWAEGPITVPRQQVAPTGQAVRVMVRHVYIVPLESSHVEYP